MELIDYKKMSKLINIAVATSKIQKLETPHKEIRPFIHLLLYGKIGSGKSSILKEVGNKFKQIPIMGITKATLLGAVDKTTGMFSPPAVWDCRNSVLLIDEFHIDKNSDRDMLNGLLSIMESPKYVKRIGYRCNDFTKKDGDLYCIVKENKISCNTRFVLFINTMMNMERSQLFEITALKSRCIVIPYYPSLEDIKRKARGEPHYIYKEYKVPKKVKINNKEYEKILEFIDSKNISVEYYLRLLGDLCRTYAVIGYDEEMFGLMCALATQK